jgi:nucleoside-diphosphate-sugar epimerase
MSQPSEKFWNGRNVVVTGGAGFVGGAVRRDLKAIGADVRVVRWAQHDLRDPVAARAAAAAPGPVQAAAPK